MKTIILSTALSLFSISSFAQHDHDHEQKAPIKPTPKAEAQSQPKKDTTKPVMKMGSQKDSMPMDHSGHDHGAMQTQQNAAPQQQHAGDHSQHAASMSHAFSRNLPMTRNGSGTAWMPDNTPMYGYMFHTNKWMYMLHGNAFLRYNKQDLVTKEQEAMRSLICLIW